MSYLGKTAIVKLAAFDKDKVDIGTTPLTEARTVMYQLTDQTVGQNTTYLSRALCTTPATSKTQVHQFFGGGSATAKYLTDTLAAVAGRKINPETAQFGDNFTNSTVAAVRGILEKKPQSITEESEIKVGSALATDAEIPAKKSLQDLLNNTVFAGTEFITDPVNLTTQLNSDIATKIDNIADGAFPQLDCYDRLILYFESFSVGSTTLKLSGSVAGENVLLAFEILMKE